MSVNNSYYPTPEDTSGDLVITKDDVSYQLPTGWALTDFTTFEMNNKLQDRAYAHGSYVVGDNKISGRTVKVEFDMLGLTREEHDEMVNLAYQHFYQLDYTLQVGRIDRIYKIGACSKIKAKYYDGFKQRRSNIEVSLLLSDSFRYSTESTTLSFDFNEEQKDTEMTFNNPSSVDVPLIWRFAPPKGGSTRDITVFHRETGEHFDLNDTLLTNPAVATVNAELGTVRRDKSNSLNTFSGIFLHAKPGSNTFLYTGAACKITIEYTSRWFT